MIGCSIGTPIGCPGRRQTVPGEATGTVSFAFTVDGLGAAEVGATGTTQVTFTVQGIGGSIVVFDRHITATDVIHLPVDYTLGGWQREKRRTTRGTPGTMTKSMMNKIFNE